MPRLVRQVRATIDRHGLLAAGDTVVLGVSGGPDSMCMLHVLRQLANEYEVSLHVAHLNHGIRGQDADDDARYVEEISSSWGIPCTVGLVDVPARARERGLALEEAARQARYAFLGSVARSAGGRSVAVAHNADDQVETVLMHFLRGSGIAGLRGMRPSGWLDVLRLGANPRESPDESRERIRLLRPLLDVQRQNIEAYCREHDLHTRFDRSNLDMTYFRNRLRHQLIPYLETFNPNVRQVVRRMAEVTGAEHELLRQLVDDAWPRIVRRESGQAITYDLAALRAAPLGLQRSLLREGIHRMRSSLRNINWVHVDNAVNVVRTGRVGTKATLPWGLVLTLGYEDAVMAIEGYEPPALSRPRITGCLSVPVPGSVRLQPGDWVVGTQVVERQELPQGWDRNLDPYLACIDAWTLTSPLQLRPRQAGDWFVPLGLKHRQRIRDFMINAKIPQRERATVPLLVCGDDVVWVVGWRLDGRYAVTRHTKQVVIVRFRQRGP